MSTILLTGGSGFIGSHTAVELLNDGYQVIIADNLANSSIKVLDRIKQIVGKSPAFYETDIRDRKGLDEIFTENHIDSVINFAGFKSVGESVEKPLAYYDNNICGAINLLNSMAEHGVKNFIFSSSATVYLPAEKSPITEDEPVKRSPSPYGQTKVVIEQICEDLYRSDNSWSLCMLRYFNPIGAHESGLIGESPNGIPNNLMPYITQVAVGRLEKLRVFGNDYPTPDGTGVRDYIHVVDLARGHAAALRHCTGKPGFYTYNLGSGHGVSVLDIVRAFEKANGLKIPYQVVKRRNGDVAECYADASKAEIELGWKTEKSLEDMMRDSWNWQKQNPRGYEF
jgi:UDP-glucose 4-epimerase